jgi:formylglycine-generating enzyme required for sulfatase activity
VRELYRRLVGEGWIDVWLDEEKLYPGQDWNYEIELAVEAADAILVCLTKDSVTKEGYVQRELRKVLDQADNKPEGTLFIIPIRLEECEPPRRLRTWHYVDYFPEQDRDRAYERLLGSLHKRASDLGITTKQKTDLEVLVSQAIQYESMGDFRNALQSRYKIRRIDPDFPGNDIVIRDLEKDIEVRKRAEQEAIEEERRQIEDRTSAKIPRKLSLDKLPTIAKIIVFALIVSLAIAGGNYVYQNIFAPTPSTSTPPIGVATSPSPSTSVTVETPTFTSAETPVSVGNTQISPKDGMPMVHVAAGEFIMGSNSGTLAERPAHRVYLDAFWIDQTEVTVEMYLRCVEAGKCKDRNPFIQSDYFTNATYSNYPVMNVSWEDAKAYCEWVERRLPTEAEWEMAARGEQGFVYPWGNDFGDGPVNFCDKNCSFPSANLSFDDGFAETAPVGSFPNGTSPYGVLDMAGNVAEWVADWYIETYYSVSPTTNPPGPESGEKRVFRGGSWSTPMDFGLRASYRSSSLPRIINLDIGFRCADSP